MERIEDITNNTNEIIKVLQENKYNITKKQFQDIYGIATNYNKRYYGETERQIIKAKNNLSHIKKEFRKKYGTFFLNYYSDMLEMEHLFRIIYLFTFAREDYILYIDKKRMDLKDVKKILGIKNRSDSNKVITYLLDNSIIQVYNSYIKVNNKFYHRGFTYDYRNKVVKNEKVREGCVRMFDAAIKNLYDIVKPRQHKTVDKLIKLLPYVNVKYNILVNKADVNNKDRDSLNQLSKKDIAEILEHKSNADLEISKLYLTLSGEKEPIFTKCNNKVYGTFYIINPRFMFKCKLDDIDFTVALFGEERGEK